MKKVQSAFFMLALALSSNSCKKSTDDSGNGPAITYPVTGVLCTVGIDDKGHFDTLSYWFTTNGGHITLYNKGFTKPGDQVRFVNNGNNTVSIEKKGAYVYNNKSYFYFAAGPKVVTGGLFNFEYHDFDFLRPVSSTETEFIIQRSASDKLKFTIESKAYPGYFMRTAKWKNATYPLESYLTFTTSKQQEFFFMPD